MDETANLKLPYIIAAQSQKHVTHNEALRALDAIVQLAVADKDLSAPPGSPDEGARYIIGASPTGSWSGHATHVAAWQDGAWAFYVPVAGWLAWVDDESESYLFSGGGWIPAPGGAGASLVPKGAWSALTSYATGDLVEHEGYAFLSNVDANVDNEPDADTPGSTGEWTYFSVLTGGGGGGGGEGSVNPVSLVGVNATADETNRLSVASPASLFSHEGAGHQLKINKDTAGDTASVLFQTDFSGRAEFGLAGDDDFHVKVSPDGSTWREAIVINRSSGAVRASGLREVLAANRTYYVRTDGNDSNTGLANSAGSAFLTIQKAIDTVAALDVSIYTVTIQVGAGSYSGQVVLKNFVGAGTAILLGDTTTPSNVVLNRSGSGDTITCPSGITSDWRVRGFRITPTTGQCIGVRSGSILTVDGNMEYAATSSYHLYVASSRLLIAAGYSITGGAAHHWRAENVAMLHMMGGLTVTLTGTPAFSASYVLSNRSSTIIAFAMTFSGSATGARYAVQSGSLIETNGAGPNYFPGNAAGSGTNYGASPWGLYV
jgi:hypothetical protein